MGKVVYLSSVEIDAIDYAIGMHTQHIEAWCNDEHAEFANGQIKLLRNVVQKYYSRRPKKKAVILNSTPNKQRDGISTYPMSNEERRSRGGFMQ